MPSGRHESADFDGPALGNGALATRAIEILRDAIQGRFAGRVALVSSFGAESAALLHMVAQIDRETPIIFLDTGRHFPETEDYRKALCARLALTGVIVAKPDARRLADEDRDLTLFARSPDRCCHIRKVLPLAPALDRFDAWITGRKAYQNPDRANLPVYESVGGRVKINPLVDWAARDVLAYIDASRLPPHPLVARGFSSIGCAPCTSSVGALESPRSGRWRGTGKTECGIHAR